MGKRKLMNLINLGLWSNYKKKPTYKHSKKQNKENVSNHDSTKTSLLLTPLTGTPHIGQPLFIYEPQEEETENISIPELSLQQEVLSKGQLT